MRPILKPSAVARPLTVRLTRVSSTSTRTRSPHHGASADTSAASFFVREVSLASATRADVASRTSRGVSCQGTPSTRPASMRSSNALAVTWSSSTCVGDTWASAASSWSGDSTQARVQPAVTWASRTTVVNRSVASPVSSTTSSGTRSDNVPEDSGRKSHARLFSRGRPSTAPVGAPARAASTHDSTSGCRLRRSSPMARNRSHDRSSHSKSWASARAARRSRVRRLASSTTTRRTSIASSSRPTSCWSRCSGSSSGTAPATRVASSSSSWRIPVGTRTTTTCPGLTPASIMPAAPSMTRR